MTSLLVASTPSLAELETLVPEGWELVEARIIPATAWETDEDDADEGDWFDSDDEWDYAEISERELEDA